MKESLEEKRLSWETERGSRPDAIHRKPLPSPRVGGTSHSRLLQTSSSDDQHVYQSRLEGENLAQAGRNGEGTEDRRLRVSTGSSTISRKPVGPRPFQQEFKATDSAILQRKPVGGSDAEESTRQRQRAWTEVPPQMQSSEFSTGSRLANSLDYPRSSGSKGAEARFMSDDWSQAPPLPPRMSYSSSEHGNRKDFRVTIIRRDPTSGAQWNIGRLTREQSPALVQQDSLRIEITTPGYQKFARQLDFQAPAIKAFELAVAENRAGSVLDGHLLNAESYCATPKALMPTSTPFHPTPFTRDIITRRSSSHPRKGSHHHHQRSSSSDSFPFSSSKPTGRSPSNTQAHLTFSSPWQGICTFTTGMDGRSLNCRHKLPASQSDQTDTSALVAELRFNLPWSTLRSRDLNVGPPASATRPNSRALLSEDAKHSFKKGMARIRQELNSTSSDTDVRSSLSTSSAAAAASSPLHDDSDSSSTTPSTAGRLDLRLGRERAGGGRKGKSAKLGKLVVRDEGLKMADLVVAASVGVWWEVYGGTGGGGLGS